MQAWHETTLGDLLHVEHGYAFKGEFFSSEGVYIVLTPGNFHEEGGFKLRPGKDRFYSSQFPERYLLREGDLIVAMTEQAEGLLGSSAWIPESGKFLLNQRLGRIHPVEGTADKRFLYYLFNTNVVRQQIRNSSSGAKVRHTSPNRIYRTKVRVPDVETQRKIAGILSAYDDLIENNRRRIAILERMAEEIYREWFVRMRFPGHQTTNFTKGVPEGWSETELSGIVDVNPESLRSSTKHETIRYVDIGSVITDSINGFEELATGQAPGRAKRIVRHGDIIWSSVRPGNRAHAIVLDPPDNLIVSTGFAVLRHKPDIPVSFLYQAVTTDSFVGYLELVAKGAAYPATAFDDFERAPILLPTSDLLTEYDRLVHPMLEQRMRLDKSIQQLKSCRDLAIGRLISGRLPVDDLDIHLPESMPSEETDEGLAIEELAHA